MKPMNLKLMIGATIIMFLFAGNAWADGRGKRGHHKGGHGYHDGYKKDGGHHYKGYRHGHRHHYKYKRHGHHYRHYPKHNYRHGRPLEQSD